MAGPPGAPRLTHLAAADLDDILRWTRREFGAAQVVRYRELLFTALRNLADGPLGPGTRSRDEVSPGLRSMRPRGGRHLILFRLEDGGVVVTRFLHDAMDLTRHLPP